MRFIDSFLESLTMYRLMLYYVAALVMVTFALGLFKIVPQDPTAIAFSMVLIIGVCWITNNVFIRIFDIPANSESIYITSLILVLILDPVTASDKEGVGVLIFASVWAMASKFILAVGRRHLFNPAAFGVVLSAFLLDHPATWWIGSSLPLIPVVLLGGALMIRKLQRVDLVLTFVIANLAAALLSSSPSQYGTMLKETLQSSPLFFFAFVMLTEPLTAPIHRLHRFVFAGLVGILFAPKVHVGSLYFTPELALLVGNLFAYITSPKGRFMLTLQCIEQSAIDTYDFVFRSQRKLVFQAGQYLEWTLRVDHPDNRGNRRYFTIASAPTEESVRLGVKFYPASSAFKRALSAMAPGDTIVASQLAGEFILPSNPDSKIAFLAGGIGITPFRSMLQYLLDRNEARPIVVLYGTETVQDIAYRDVLDAAEHELGIWTVYAVARGAERGQYPGHIDARLVREAIPDYRERIFYISGPQAMVKALRRVLQTMGIRRSRIKVDLFIGFG
jgi:ferredoxin-NADP reductase